MVDLEAIDLPGRVLLPDGTELNCKVRCHDIDLIEIGLSVVVEPGAQLLCHVDGLGAIEGMVGEATPAGVRLHIQGTTTHLSRLAARLIWHRRMAAGQDDKRERGRIVPKATEICVRSATGAQIAGTLIDLSATGAALRMPTRPEIGSTIVIGRRRATVVRYIDEGVAVRFHLPLRAQDVTPDVVL